MKKKVINVYVIYVLITLGPFFFRSLVCSYVHIITSLSKALLICLIHLFMFFVGCCANTHLNYSILKKKSCLNVNRTSRMLKNYGKSSNLVISRQQVKWKVKQASNSFQQLNCNTARNAFIRFYRKFYFFKAILMQLWLIMRIIC